MKKFLKKVCSFLIRHFRKIWYSGMLMAASLYVVWYRFEIYELKELNARNLIFLLWILLLFLPLINEMEFLGLKIKKEVKEEIEKSTEEIKSAIQNVQSLVSVSQNAQNVNIGSTLISIEQLREMLLQNGIDPNHDNFYTSDSDINKYVEISSNYLEDDSKRVYHAPKDEFFNSDAERNRRIYLLDVRTRIELSVRALCESTGFDRVSSFVEMLQHLQRKEIIDRNTKNLLKEVYRIASKSIHGEVISPEYFFFVEKISPKIFKVLDVALDKVESQSG